VAVEAGKRVRHRIEMEMVMVDLGKGSIAGMKVGLDGLDMANADVFGKKGIEGGPEAGGLKRHGGVEMGRLP
jgi:hypothetical protein